VKLEISYNVADLEEALRIAEQTARYADALHLGNLLLLSNGRFAVTRFREAFPDKDLFLDTKLSENCSANIDFFAQCGVAQISVLAGVSNKIIQQFAVTAHEKQIRVALDLVACPAPEQGVFDAQTLDIDSIIYRNPLLKDDSISLVERWASVRGNTKLPIYIAGNISLDAMPAIKEMAPEGMIVGSLITHAANPGEMAEKIREMIDGAS
jgi:3-keto-L-gulonate-6-phosphate decarboxylase